MNPADSLAKMKDTDELLEKREKLLQKKVDDELREAKKMSMSNNKRAAMMSLKKKKMYEKQLEQLNGTRVTIATQIIAVENAMLGRDAMSALQLGAKAMKAIHGDLDIDKVEDVMEVRHGGNLWGKCIRIYLFLTVFLVCIGYTRTNGYSQ